MILDLTQIADLKHEFLGQRVMFTGPVADEENEPTPLQFGDAGKVIAVDGAGTLHVKWDSGRTLGLVPGDGYEKLPKITPTSGKWVSVRDYTISIAGLASVTLASYQAWEVAEFLKLTIANGNTVTLVSQSEPERVQVP